MSTNYPGAIDSFTNPTAYNPMNNPDHAGQHTNSNDAIHAIETVIGTTALPNLLAIVNDLSDVNSPSTALDNLNGLSRAGGTMTGTIVSHGFDSSSFATVTRPSVSTGVAFTPSTVSNTMVYFQLDANTGSTTYSVSMGPTTGSENIIASGVAMSNSVDTVHAILVPKSWKSIITASNITIVRTTVITI